MSEGMRFTKEEKDEICDALTMKIHGLQRFGRDMDITKTEAKKLFMLVSLRTRLALR